MNFERNFYYLQLFYLSNQHNSLCRYTIANETPLNNNYTDNAYKSGSIVLPDGFSYKVIKVTQPENGTITKESDYIYHFSPNGELNSGKIYVTLQITKDDHARIFC